MQELNGNFSHFPKPSWFQGLEGARNNSLISHTDSVLGKKLEEECGIRRAVGAVSVFLHWPLLLLNAIPGCLYSENPLLICSTPTTQVPGLWILHPLTVLSLLLFAGSLQLLWYGWFCSQASFSNLALLQRKHIGISSHVFSILTLPFFPFHVHYLQSIFHFSATLPPSQLFLWMHYH